MVDGPLPLYEQVKDHVLSHIRAGTWRPGERVPSEHELVRELNVSRMTANRALRELTGSGVLERVPGVGTFVSDFKAAGHLLQIRNIAAEIRDRGHSHRAEIVSVEKSAPSEEVRERLALSRRVREVFHSLLVHYERDQPLQVEDRYVNPALAPGYLGVDFARITPNEYLMEVAPLQRVEHIVRATLPDARVRRLLKIAATDPVLTVERLTFSRGARASYTLLHHPGKSFELRGDFDL